MAKKKPQEEPQAEKARIEIKSTRTAGKINKNAGLFDRIQPRHPLEDIFSPPPETSDNAGNNSGETEIQLAGTQKELNGETNSQIAGIYIPVNNKRGDEKKELTGIYIPAKELTSPRKSEETKKRGRPATGRSKADAHIRISPAVWQQTREFATRNDIDFSQVVELALVRFFDKNGETENRTESELTGIYIPIDDRRLKINWKTKPALINLYLQFNSKNKWKVADDEAAHRYNEIDIRIVELGILHTQFNKQFQGKINSFSYYAPEIETWIEANLPGESLDRTISILKIKREAATGEKLDDPNRGKLFEEFDEQ